MQLYNYRFIDRVEMSWDMTRCWTCIFSVILVLIKQVL